jgi:hypothetical protein
MLQKIGFHALDALSQQTDVFQLSTEHDKLTESTA